MQVRDFSGDIDGLLKEAIRSGAADYMEKLVGNVIKSGSYEMPFVEAIPLGEFYGFTISAHGHYLLLSNSEMDRDSAWNLYRYLARNVPAFRLGYGPVPLRYDKNQPLVEAIQVSIEIGNPRLLRGHSRAILRELGQQLRDYREERRRN